MCYKSKLAFFAFINYETYTSIIIDRKSKAESDGVIIFKLKRIFFLLKTHVALKIMTFSKNIYFFRGVPNSI